MLRAESPLPSTHTDTAPGAPLAFVSDASGTGGAEFLAASLAAAILRRGRSVRFVVPRARTAEAWIRARLPAEVVVGAPLRNKSEYALRAMQAALDLPRIAALRASLAALSPAAVIVNQADAEDGVVTGLAARRAGIPTMALLHLPEDPAVHGATRFLSPRRLLARSAIGRFEKVICVSRASAAEARRTWGREALAVPNGIDLPPPEAPGERDAARRQLGIAPGAPLLVALGRLSVQKGFFDLLAALPLVRSVVPGTQLLIAGEGPERAGLERAIGKAGLEGQVHLPGWLDSRPALLAADAVVLSSRVEGLPLVLLEAGALARDVLAFAVGGIPEVLDASALSPAGDVPALAARIARSLSDPALRNERAAELARRVRRDHDIDAMAARFLEAVAL